MVKRRDFLRAVSSIIAIAALAGCSERFPDYRYRLTVYIDTPEGLKTGSSVIQIGTHLFSENFTPNMGALKYEVRGEGVAVDLGKRGVFFMTLEAEQIQDWPTHALPITADAYLGPATRFVAKPREKQVGDEIERVLAFKGRHNYPRYYSDALTSRPKNGAPPNAYPLMVAFKDLNDPESVILLDPDHLNRHFGEGVKLRAITVRLTDNAVTSGILQFLPWLTSLTGTLVKYPIDTPMGTIPAEKRLTPRDFSIGIFNHP